MLEVSRGGSGTAAIGFVDSRLRAAIQLRWADTDTYGHVNNVSYLRYMEEARIRVFGLPDQPATAASDCPPVFDGLDPGTFTLTAAHRMEYVRQLAYSGQSITAEMWLSRLGSRSIDMSFRFLDESLTEVYLIAQTTLVVCDLRSGRPRMLTERELGLLSPYLGPSLEFR